MRRGAGRAQDRHSPRHCAPLGETVDRKLLAHVMCAPIPATFNGKATDGRLAKRPRRQLAGVVTAEEMARAQQRPAGTKFHFTGGTKVPFYWLN
jgi:hypothetical protein